MQPNPGGQDHAAGAASLSIAVSGSSGLVGRSLVAHLRAEGHAVHAVVRTPVTNDQTAILWNPERGTIDSARLNPLDAVVHLGGASIAGGLWTSKRRDLIASSRVRSTGLLATTLAACSRPPPTFISASAIGYYGDRGDELLSEDSHPGQGFLSDTCRMWEAATEPAAKAGIRVVNLRIGLVLSRSGGALRAMLRPFRLGLGGTLGSGRQYVSWITLDDLVRVVEAALIDQRLRGPVNAVAPNPVTNREFTKALAAALRRPAVLPVPAWVVRLLLGDMGRELLLASTRVRPARLEAIGFAFEHPDVAAALAALLGRRSAHTPP